MNLPSVWQICFLHWQHLWAVHTVNFNSMHSNPMWILLISFSFLQAKHCTASESRQCIHLHYECNITVEHYWITIIPQIFDLWRFTPSQMDSPYLVQVPLQTPSCPCTSQSRPYCCPFQQTALWPHQSTCSTEGDKITARLNWSTSTKYIFSFSCVSVHLHVVDFVIAVLFSLVLTVLQDLRMRLLKL